MSDYGDYHDPEADGPVPYAERLDEDLHEHMDALSRKDTATTNPVSEAASDTHPTCRICRSEGTPEEPLFHPCKCSGSIQYVHQECLMEWLSHSHKKHCELCKTPFRFTKLYDADMPAQLPWDVFIKRALIHVGQGISNTARGIIVGFVWMVILPWFIRWAWRWMFWIADAGWARELYLFNIKRLSGGNLAAFWKDHNVLTQAGEERTVNNTMGPNAYKELMSGLGFDGLLPNSTGFNQTYGQWPQADSSVFSSWSYLSDLTPNSGLNRILLDIFEGQLITCVVIIGFILIFLIREWVVQQQPLVNMDHLNNVQQQLREAADRVQEENERFRRQQELLDQARRRLMELQRETEDAQRQSMEVLGLESLDIIAWDDLEKTIDRATEMLSNGDREGFEARAQIVTDQIRAAGYGSTIGFEEFTNKLYAKLASFPDEERNEWESTLTAEVQRKNAQLNRLAARKTEISESEGQDDEPTEDAIDGDEVVASGARPPMPERDFSSRATQIQRLLEEADGIFGQVHGDAAPASEDEQVEAGPSAVASSSTESRPDDSQSGKRSLKDKLAELTERVSEPQTGAQKDEIPITNAGPDAKKNIKRSGKGKIRPVPEPQNEDVSDEKVSESKSSDAEGETNAEQASNIESAVPTEQSPVAENDDTQQSETSQPDRDEGDTLADRVGSAFREEFGLAQVPEPENRHVVNVAQDNITSTSDVAQGEARQEQRPEDVPRGSIYDRLADWFWGDINATNAPEPVPTAREERLDDHVAGGDQAPPPVQAAGDGPGQPQQPVDEGRQNQPDPEVAAAAAQAGLDAEAVEDAEDLEGIFELIGLQGPLTALFQTSMFCLVLVSGTVFTAVGLPYVFGKLVLSFIGSPVYFIFKLPLQSASFIADLVIDFSLFVGGWAVLIVGLISEVIYTALSTMMHLPSSAVLVKLTDASMKTATASGTRLQSLFITEATGDMGWNGAFLGASVHSHASLRSLQQEVNAVLSFVGRSIVAVADAISHGSFAGAGKQITKMISYVPAVPAKLLFGVEIVKQYAAPVIEALSTLKSGALTLKVPSTSPASIDPALIFWSASDRTVAVIFGYIALAMVAALYVAADTPITSSVAGQRHEKMIRDTLRQAGGVLKVILIISIEMLMFPLYCGLLLDVAFLPLFGGASISSRLAFAASNPYTFCFVHWFVGTCYMFHFALFVGMCRKILRKGVLWFIRDPDDPTFHPVRDVLERNVTTQLRKIAFSALVYGALVILCLGGVIWTIGKVFKGIFPIQWISTEPVLEFPVDLLLYNFVTPLLIRLFKPSDTVNSLYAWWLRRCARFLRLSHFMFDDRRPDEEGHHVHRTWLSVLLMRRADASGENVVLADQKLRADTEETPEVYLQRDGKYVLTPCSDQYRPPKAGEAFLHSDDDDVYIADREGKKNEHFAKMYVPPLFRIRVTLFMVCLWMFSAATGLCVTLVPLGFGRHAIGWAFPGVQVNDIYAYTLGAYTLSGVLYAVMKSGQAARSLREKAQAIDLRAWLAKVARFALKFAKCTYVYGFLGIALPTFFAFVLQFYLILPLHTYLVASAHEQATQNATMSTANITAQVLSHTNLTSGSSAAETPSAGPWLASHNIHLLQDFALGLVYCRIVSRTMASAPSSRAAEAFRRITAAGYLNPNTRLATRFFILPFLLLMLVTFFLPPLGAWTFIQASQSMGVELEGELQTLLYRYSFPCLGTVFLVLVGGLEVMRATERWRARVRDEVYLVGERLHNFGEKKPPVGTKSVVRRERGVGRREGDAEW